MRYPKLRITESSRQMVDTFKGYNHNLRIGDGEFFDMKNMTSDHYPVLSPRGKRGVYASPTSPTGLITKDALCYVDGTKFFINQTEIDMGLDDEPKQLISMGAYVIILPEKAPLHKIGNGSTLLPTSGAISRRSIPVWMGRLFGLPMKCVNWTELYTKKSKRAHRRLKALKGLMDRKICSCGLIFLLPLTC